MEYYAAIRRTEGREWIDISTLSWCRKTAANKAERQDSLLPRWAEANPVVWVSVVEVRELAD
jgi:hypothetical protein